MFCWLCLTLLAPIPAPAPQIAAPPVRFPNVVIVNGLNRPNGNVCSIPLLRAAVGKGFIDRMSVAHPENPAGAHFSMRYVSPPAPPCDDGKR